MEDCEQSYGVSTVKVSVASVTEHDRRGREVIWRIQDMNRLYYSNFEAIDYHEERRQFTWYAEVCI
jgi:hypothetical protein